MMSYMGIPLALAMLKKLWLRPRRVNCGRCFLRDEACKEFGGVVRTHKSSVLICKDIATVHIGILQIGFAVLLPFFLPDQCLCQNIRELKGIKDY